MHHTFFSRATGAITVGSRRSFRRRKPVELLETRVLLSAAVSNVNIHDAKAGPMANSGSNLIDLYLDYRSAQRSTASSGEVTRAFTSAQSDSDDTDFIDVRGDTVGVDVQTSGNAATLATTLSSEFGMAVNAINGADKIVSGYLPVTFLRQLAQTDGVVSVNPIYKPTVNKEGISDDQGNYAEEVSALRNEVHVEGQGMTIGVISDSVNQVGNGLSDSVKSGDLPTNVDVLSDGVSGDTDEGRAMLEAIYDLAPRAKLVFASGDGGQQAFANAIANVSGAGANVIVDDIGYADEPFFQPGIIDAAVNAAISAGATYITAAGNTGTSGFEQAANFVTDPNPPTGTTPDQLINFDPNPLDTAATRMTITTTKTGNVTLEWSDAYNGISGTVRSDLDIYFYNAAGSTVVASGTSNNMTTGVPVETVHLPAGTYQVEIRAPMATVANLPKYYEFTGDVGLTTTQFTGTRTSIIGHSAFSNAITVGAVPFYNSPPYSAASPVATESFTSAGPALEVRNANGTNLRSATLVQKPDISGTDAIDTSFFGSDIPQDSDTLPNFIGTSASAANIAGIAALLIQENQRASNADIRRAFKDTAAPVNGAAAQTYDDQGGFGLVNAVSASAFLDTLFPAPTATLDAIQATSRSTVDEVDITFSQNVKGVDISDFTLTRDGSSTNLLGKDQTLTALSKEDYELTGLSAITSVAGSYTLTLKSANSGIVDADGKPLPGDAVTNFVKLPVPLAPTALDYSTRGATSVALRWIDNATNETTYTVQVADDPHFTSNKRSFTIAANSTSYTVTGLTRGKAYYFRVFASDANGDSNSSNTAAIATLSIGEVIIDDTEATTTGTWTTVPATSVVYGSSYLTDGDSNKGHKTVHYTPTIDTGGAYFIYTRWVGGADRAKDVPVRVYTNATAYTTVFIDERKSVDGWVLLGKFTLPEGRKASVVIMNKSTTGLVVADAVRFLPANANMLPA